MGRPQLLLSFPWQLQSFWEPYSFACVSVSIQPYKIVYSIYSIVSASGILCKMSFAPSGTLIKKQKNWFRRENGICHTHVFSISIKLLYMEHYFWNIVHIVYLYRLYYTNYTVNTVLVDQFHAISSRNCSQFTSLYICYCMVYVASWETQ